MATLPSMTLESPVLNRKPSSDIWTCTLLVNAMHLSNEWSCRAELDTAENIGWFPSIVAIVGRNTSQETDWTRRSMWNDHSIERFL